VKRAVPGQGMCRPAVGTLDAGRYEERAMTTPGGGVVCGITISADGQIGRLNQIEQRPFGDDGGDKLHAWFAETPEENRAVIDQMTAANAFIMGRNMFGPVRGQWDRQWNGWWGDDHQPVPRRRSDRRAAPAHRAAHARRRHAAVRGRTAVELEQVQARAATLVTHVTYRVLS
jgi:dihydrofolate reductase